MKLLLIYCKEFEYTPALKTLENALNNVTSKQYENIQVAFIQAEQEDSDKAKDIETKLIKNIKWICGKNQTKHIVLHSFAHLSESKADPVFTQILFNKVEERLKNAGYDACQTPFGYFLDLNINAPGFSLARVFKSF